MMRVSSLNLRRGLYKNYNTIIGWLRNNKIDILLSQDPFKEFKSSFVYDPSSRPVGGNNRVHIFQSANRYQIRLIKQDEFCQYAIVNDILIVNLYLNSSSKTIRSNQLYQIKAYLSNNKYPLIISGDFNLATKIEDGLFDNKPSTWNSTTDRKPFFDLLNAYSLIDLGEKIPKGYTYEKDRRGKLIQFRCDLCLVSESLLERIQLKYDHTVRNGPSAFTDHSALIIDILGSNKYELESKTNLGFVQTKIVKNDDQSSNRPEYRFDLGATAISGRGLTSYAKKMVEYRKNLQFRSVLDFGCGWSKDVEYYQTQGLQAMGYDPDKRFCQFKKPDRNRKFDLVTMIFVLNVIPYVEKRLKAISEAKKYLNEKGALLIVVRTKKDIERNAKGKKGRWEKYRKGRWEKYSDGYISKKLKDNNATFQKGLSKENIIELAEKVGLSLHPKDHCINFKQKSCYALFINDG